MFFNFALTLKCFKRTFGNVIFFFWKKQVLPFKITTQAEFCVLHQTKCNMLPNLKRQQVEAKGKSCTEQILNEHLLFRI